MQENCIFTCFLPEFCAKSTVPCSAEFSTNSLKFTALHHPWRSSWTPLIFYKVQYSTYDFILLLHKKIAVAISIVCGLSARLSRSWQDLSKVWAFGNLGYFMGYFHWFCKVQAYGNLGYVHHGWWETEFASFQVLMLWLAGRCWVLVGSFKSSTKF